MTSQAAGHASPSPSLLGSTILLVEDDPSVAELLTTALGARNYTVIVTRTGEAALRAVAAARPDLVLLDLGLPDMDGLDVCEQIRRTSTVPIVVLTADGDSRRKVEALDLGADDYVTKPFDTPELMARLRVAERHHGAASADAARSGPGSVPATRRIGNVEIDPDAHVVTVHGRPLRLTRTEYQLLGLLAERPGALVTHGAIRDAVWDGGGTIESLRVHITNLRRKLGDDAGVELRTDPGVGYRLIDATPL